MLCMKAIGDAYNTVWHVLRHSLAMACVQMVHICLGFDTRARRASTHKYTHTQTASHRITVDLSVWCVVCANLGWIWIWKHMHIMTYTYRISLSERRLNGWPFNLCLWRLTGVNSRGFAFVMSYTIDVMMLILISSRSSQLGNIYVSTYLSCIIQIVERYMICRDLQILHIRWWPAKTKYVYIWLSMVDSYSFA